MENNFLQIGDRIQLSDFRGTVRYIGTIQNQKGDYVGVEWDDVSRGKHDGTLNGVQYFLTKDDSPSGSFVPWDRFSMGVSLVSAVHARYTGLLLSHEDSDLEEEMFVSTTSNRAKRIELVGINKVQNQQKKTHLLTSVDVSGACITHIGSLEELSNSLRSLIELNVSFNFIRSWEMVLEIISSLPQLQILNLSGNPFLRTDVQLFPAKEDISTHLQTLVFNECQLKWEQAIEAVDCLSAVSELQVCLNNLSCLSLPNVNGHAFLKLQTIDFTYNGIKHWEDVAKLSSMPLLKKLNLSSNPLQSVEYFTDTPGYFASLETLILGDCLIDSWESVGALNLFPKLKETRTSGNPLLQSVSGGGRFEIVARVEGLIQLNGSKISRQERVDCERRYISLVASLIFSEEDINQQEAVKALHPRYDELVEKHGAPSSSASTVKQTGALKENVVEVTLLCHAPSAGKELESLTKKLSLNMSLGSLRTLIEKLFILPKQKIKMYLKSDNTGFPEDISDIKDDKKLRDLYIVDGQEILINE